MPSKGLQKKFKKLMAGEQPENQRARSTCFAWAPKHISRAKKKGMLLESKITSNESSLIKGWPKDQGELLKAKMRRA